MDVAFRAAGTVASSTSGGNLSPGVPAGTVAGDILVLEVAHTSTAASTSVSGYTIIRSETNFSTMRGSLWYKIAGAGESAPSVTFSGLGASDLTIARIAGFSDPAQTSTVESIAWDYNGGIGQSVAGDTITPSVDNCMIVCCGAASTNQTTLSFGVFSGANPSMTERFDNFVYDGKAVVIAICLDSGLQGSASGTARSSLTDSPTSIVGGGIQIVIKPPAAASYGYAYVSALARAKP